jgi:hypothetical protein
MGFWLASECSEMIDQNLTNGKQLYADFAACSINDGCKYLRRRVRAATQASCFDPKAVQREQSAVAAA